MKFYQSIRFRIVACILLYGSLLVIFNAGITFFVMGNNISKMVANLIDTEVDTFLYKYKKDRTTPLPHSKYIDVFEGVEAVPERFREQVKDLPPGVHAINRDDKKHPKYVGVMELEGKDVPSFMFFHGRAFFEENARLHPRQILMISLALLLIPGVIIGYITSRMLFAPVVTLMDQIKGLNPDNIPSRFSQKHASNELGMLTRTIETTMNRINAFIQREKQFTRDASHELRTPLTIVKGAVEIMEAQPELEGNPLLKNPLKRISRSVRDMETTIETFLWLAREEGGTESSCRVEPVARKAIKDNRYLIENKDIELHMDVRTDKAVRVREEVLYIAVTNLIRNAFHFTSRGAVTVTIDDMHIGIADTGMGIEADKLDSVTRSHVKGQKSRGFGLGLSIVSRLCKRFGWQLIIESEPGKGTRTRILWQDA
ncbi:two-component sensor histidine kinase [Desulfosarcina alkanivorans]|uniref:histidine kinase n=1 Tax=Desulfosarcina alkanivorans TaxID=571177 RepID=A0A5K7YF25_9BACT|nr:HAMP domain-containing sensor histidine kinase [Desulfosarcina alkanivorans]BBO67668.1 two-component sensor histidine kinase [Desulfosarcina alkanivorans]